MARKLPEINASSTADIAFLLLSFFLMVTTMDVDSGLPRMLPPMPQGEQETDIEVKRRNILQYLSIKATSYWCVVSQWMYRYSRKKPRNSLLTPITTLICPKVKRKIFL